MRLGKDGFSLIEVVMAIGIVSGLALVVASLASNSFQLEARLNAKQDVRSLAVELEEIVKASKCGIVTMPFTLTDSNVTSKASVSLATGVSWLGLSVVSGKSYGKLAISAVAVSPWINKTATPWTSSFVIADGAANYLASTLVKAQLQITYSAPLGSNNTMMTGNVTRTIYLTKAAASESITDCNIETETASSFAQAVCESVGGVFDTTNVLQPCTLSSPTSANSSYCVPGDSCGVQSWYTQSL